MALATIPDLQTVRRAIVRLMLGVGPTAAISAVHFVLQFYLLHLLDQNDYGSFAFIFTTIQFLTAISNALLAAPYAIFVNAGEAARDDGFFFSVNALLSLAMVPLGALLTFMLSHSAVTALLWGAASGFSVLRWFGRAHAIAHHDIARAAVSDFTYAGIIAMGTLVLARAGIVSLGTVALLLALAALVGTLAFGWRFLIPHFRRTRLLAYREIWKDQSSWALLGVVSSEAANNAQNYLVTIISGPAALAPIAAAGLFLKPLLVSLNALIQIDRPRLVRAVASGDRSLQASIRRHLGGVLITCWLATLVLVFVVLRFAPDLIHAANFDRTTVAAGISLWMLIGLLLVIQTPGNLHLQCETRFHALALINMASGAISLAAALALLFLLPPVYSLAGVVCGTLYTTIAIRRCMKQP